MVLKRHLENLYKEWQEKIDGRILNDGDIFHAHGDRNHFDKTIKTQLEHLEAENSFYSKSENQIQELNKIMEQLEKYEDELSEKFENFLNFVDSLINDVINENVFDTDDEEQQRLTTARVQQFEQFQADESFVNDQCTICMEHVEVGRNMMRLDCDGQHTFCQVCIEEWFADHKTCPICRHVF